MEGNPSSSAHSDKGLNPDPVVDAFVNNESPCSQEMLFHEDDDDNEDDNDNDDDDDDDRKDRFWDICDDS